MATRLIRAGWILPEPDKTEVIRNAGLLIVDGLIAEIGDYERIRERHPRCELIGGPHVVAAPGFVNAHQHGLGLSSPGLGYSDKGLECWVMRRFAPPELDIYLDTLYSAVRMLESGVTSVVHSHYYRGPDAYELRLDDALRAYRDVGMRVVFAPNIWEMNFLVYGDAADWTRSLPPDTQAYLAAITRKGSGVELRDYFAAVDDLRRRTSNLPLVTVGYAPVGPQWCSDELLTEIRDRSEDERAAVHIHVLETLYQAEYGHRAHQQSLVAHLEGIGFLSERVSCAHAVWLTADDMEIVRSAGASLVHNPSSNLRLHSGIAPVSQYLEGGVRLALGTDNMSLNDDEDFLLEMRMAWMLHRLPGLDQGGPTAGDIWRMATRGGAEALLIGDSVGTLVPGMRADIVLIDARRIADLPASDSMPMRDHVLRFCTKADVTHVLVDGEVRVADGHVVAIDAVETRRRLLESVQLPNKEARAHQANMESAVQSFYRGWGESVSGVKYRALD